MHEAADVLGVEDANDEFRAALRIINGDAGVHFLDNAGAGIFDQHIGGEREDALARGHDLAGDDVVHLDGAVDERLLVFGQHAGAARSRGHELELFGGVDGALVGERRVKETQDQPGGAVEQADEWTGETDENFHGPGNTESHLVGAAESERFWDELAEENDNVGDEGEGQRDGGEVRVEAGVGKAGHGLLEEGGDSGLAEPAHGEAAEGDPELDGGKEIAQILLEAADDARAGTVFLNELLNARFADADQSELRRDEETVGEDQHDDGDAVEEEELRHLKTGYSVQGAGGQVAGPAESDAQRTRSDSLPREACVERLLTGSLRRCF